MHWGCTRIPSGMHWKCTRDAPGLHQRCTGVAPGLQQRCIRVAPGLHQSRIRDAPEMHQGCTYEHNLSPNPPSPLLPSSQPPPNQEGQEVAAHPFPFAAVVPFWVSSPPPSPPPNKRNNPCFALLCSNIAEALVSKGLATVIRYRQDDDQRSSHYDELLAAEAR